jgi:copper chaperone CopZ
MTPSSPVPFEGAADRAYAGHPVTTQLAVGGMHCPACATLIEESLAELAGVITASVDLDSARAVVAYDPSLVGVEGLRSVVAEAGYSAMQVG